LGPTYVDNNSIFHGWISKKASGKLLDRGLKDEKIPDGAGLCIIRGSSKESSIVICVKVKGSLKDADHYLVTVKMTKPENSSKQSKELRVEMLRQQQGQYRLMANRNAYFPFVTLGEVFTWIHLHWKNITFGLTYDKRIIRIEDFLKHLYILDDEESPYWELDKTQN